MHCLVSGELLIIAQNECEAEKNKDDADDDEDDDERGDMVECECNKTERRWSRNIPKRTNSQAETEFTSRTDTPPPPPP